MRTHQVDPHVQLGIAMAESGLNIDNSVQNRIGEPGTRIRRIKEKTVRGDVGRLLAEPNLWPAEMRLRGYLAIGRPPEPALLTPSLLRRALSAGDCVVFAKLLARRNVFIDADAVFSTLASYMRSERGIQIERIAPALARTVTRWHSKKAPLPLDTPSLRAYIDVVFALLEKTRESQSRVRKTLDPVLLKLVIFAVLDAGTTGTTALQFQVLKLLASANNVLEPELSDALDRLDDFRSARNSVINGTIEQLRRMAISGKKDDFQTSARNLLRSKVAERETKQLLETLYSDRGQLDPDIQRALADLLELSHETRSPVPKFEASPGASVQSTQLASSLIRSWSAANDSPHAREAFDELRSVLRNFFRIELKGEPGETAEFNPLVHELVRAKDERPLRVRLIRPRIEISDGSVTTILIKGLAEPV